MGISRPEWKWELFWPFYLLTTITSSQLGGWCTACQFIFKSQRFEVYDKILVEKVVKFSISETLNRFYLGNFRRQNSCQDITK